MPSLSLLVAGSVHDVRILSLSLVRICTLRTEKWHANTLRLGAPIAAEVNTEQRAGLTARPPSAFLHTGRGCPSTSATLRTRPGTSASTHGTHLRLLSSHNTTTFHFAARYCCRRPSPSRLHHDILPHTPLRPSRCCFFGLSA
jgi:hypothetical protein